MFNTPILDVALGLMLVYLLYSLLATSVKEGIATLFGMRARMLKKGISSMLTLGSKENRWKNFLKGIRSYAQEIVYVLTGWRREQADTLASRFYSHPLISSYGSNRMFPHPSYIPAANFSQVLVDLLNKDFDAKAMNIAQQQLTISPGASANTLYQNLWALSEAQRIQALLDYYKSFHVQGAMPEHGVIDPDTWQILQLHLLASNGQMDAFYLRLETWFNDTMNRVSGWYKRQVQFILFAIGIALAIVLNIDTIEMASKLSKNKDLRAQMVQLAIQAPEKFRNDVRTKGLHTKGDSTAFNEMVSQFQKSYGETIQMLKHDSTDATRMLALGWNQFGKTEDRYRKEMSEMSKPHPLFSPLKHHIYKVIHQCKNVDEAYETSPTSMRIWYVWHATTLDKFFGFMLTAFAIALGAPFWFDLLNKAVNLRGSGKPETDKK